MDAGMWPRPGASGAFRAENLETRSPALQGSISKRCAKIPKNHEAAEGKPCKYLTIGP